MPDKRLATQIRPDVDERLRLLAAATGRRIGHLISDLLDGCLPTRAELADRIREGGAPGDGS